MGRIVIARALLEAIQSGCFWIASSFLLAMTLCDCLATMLCDNRLLFAMTK